MFRRNVRRVNASPMLCVWLLGLGLMCGPELARGEDQTQTTANRLAKESSPYLLLHAHNPVDWFPWGPEAFEKARAENKPIFLSIGYSSCYWCHVMERLVFSNAEIAAYMNQHFVNVKVDREERPDLDDIYMLALQVYQQIAGTGGGGGWPLSMFLTPEGNPIAGGTYFPPDDQEGRPGFRRVMEQVQNVWTTRRDDVDQTARLIAENVQRLSVPQVQLTPVAPGAELVQSSIVALKQSYDPEHGGLDFHPDQPNGPKFPVPSRLGLLQSRIPFDQTGELEEIVDHTLERMAAGGIHDQVGGGFHRYSTDRYWLVPHFEKMLYDNAQLAEVYVDAYRRTSRASYRRVAEGIFDFILREMTAPEGGFYSALDAETDGVEGKFYVWTREEIEQVVGAADAPAVFAAYGLNRPLEFEHGFVLNIPAPLSEIAKSLMMPESELDLRLAESRQKLLAARSQRPALLRDEKVLTSWNGLMIRAFARAGKVLNREDYRTAAENAAIYVLSKARGDDGRLLRTVTRGEGRLNAYLDDYAFLVSGLLELHASTGEEKWLNTARRLTDDQFTLFWDNARGGFYFTTHDHEQLIARTKNAYDSVIPSGNSVASENLVLLAKITGEVKYREHAARTLEVFAPFVQQHPQGLAYMSWAMQQYVDANGAKSGPATLATPAASLLAETGTPRSTPNELAQAGTDGGPRSEPAEKLVPFAEADAEEAAKHDKIKAKAYLSTSAFPAGGTCRIALVIDVAEPWHINANPAQPDFVIPTELTAKFNSGTELKMATYPKGHEFKIEGIDEPLSVYEGQIILLGDLTVPREAAGKSDEFVLTLRYQACDSKSCSRPMRMVIKGTALVAKDAQSVTPVNAKLFNK